MRSGWSTMFRAAAPATFVGLLGASGCTVLLGVDFEGRLADASVDAAGDAPLEGAPDAALEAEASFCMTVLPKPDFCADFDRGELLAAWAPSVFVNPWISGGGAIEADETLWASAPRSMRASSPAIADTTMHVSAYVGADFTELPRYVLFEQEVRIDTELFSGDSGAIDIFSLRLGEVGEIRLRRDEEGTSLVVVEREGGAPGGETTTAARFSSPLPVGQWTSMIIRLKNYGDDGPDGGSEGRVTVFLGGTVAKLATPVSFQDVTGHPYRLRVGVLDARGPVGIFRINFDNVRLTGYAEAR
jgi:hypothetical protein